MCVCVMTCVAGQTESSAWRYVCVCVCDDMCYVCMYVPAVSTGLSNRVSLFLIEMPFESVCLPAYLPTYLQEQVDEPV